VTEEKPEPPPSARERLFALHDAMCKSAKATMRKKNFDYAKEDDPYHNFRRHGLKGFVVRMDDKMCRLDGFVDKGTLSVEDESIQDTLEDLINYAVLFRGWLEEKKVKS
jgi:hypothetical protein